MAGAIHMTTTSTHNNVTGNYMNRDGYVWTQSGGINLVGSSHNFVADNIMNDTYVPFQVSISFNNKIHNNTIISGQGYFEVYNSFYNNFTSNTVTNAHGIRVRKSGENRFEYNIIHDNSRGILLEESTAVIEYNNIYNNSMFNLEVKDGNYSAKNNWWGTLECNIIANQIDDCLDSPLYSCVDWEPILDAAYPGGAITACADTIPPGKVRNLFSFNKGDDWINWEWHNPSSYDFDYSIIYIDGVNVANTSDDFYTANGLATNATHTITINTADTRGNINTDNVSSTVVIGTLPADLIIKSARVYTKEPEVGKWTSFEITIENTGIGTAAMIEWAFESGMPEQNLTFGEFTVEPGNTVDIYPAFKYNSSGNYNAVFTIDPDNVVYETDNSNNNVTIPVTIA